MQRLRGDRTTVLAAMAAAWAEQQLGLTPLPNPRPIPIQRFERIRRA